jgi:pyrroloquinoline quinone biosynthesis protein B
LAVLAADGAVLFDASPDLRHQQATLHRFPEYGNRIGNAFDAVFLTHAHMGHYTGLVHFGKEAHASRDLAVFGSERMQLFLAHNEPWTTLFRDRHLRFEVMADGSSVNPVDDLIVRAVAVPHRDEFSDNLAYVIQVRDGASALYLPDLDRWSDWPAAAAEIAAVDVALIDGTFFSSDDPVGRDIAEIPHPPMRDSVERFADLGGNTRIVFTHLNHSNPAGDPAGDEASWVLSRGFEIATDGVTFDL